MALPFPRVARAVAVAALVLLARAPAAAQHHDHHVPDAAGFRGERFETTCRPPVAELLDRGVHQLHVFAFDEAVAAFRQAAHSDIDCTAAYWGTAMAHWGRFARSGRADVLAEGWRAIDSADLLLREPSDREARYLDAVRTRYRERLDGGQARYADAMTTLARDYPRDSHAALFAALARIEQPAATKAEAQRLRRAALELLEGDRLAGDGVDVLHYTVLAGDHPDLAGRVLPKARALAHAAETSAYLRRLPVGVFVRLGLWDEALDAGRRAADAARGAGSPGDELHALEALVYVQLQAGRLDEARAVARRLQAGYLAGVSEPGATAVRMSIAARVAVESGDPAIAAALPIVGPADAAASAPGHLARTIGAARLGRADDAARAAADLAASVPPDDIAGQAMTRMARAWAAFALGRTGEALDIVRAVADAEDTAPAGPAWPPAILPAREQLGDLLLAAGRPREAAAAYARVLERFPGRARARAGAAAAAAR